ncbi:hypothetical protein [Actinopolymorpha pittospori]|uniref:Uncharacterized protein n=1 Tax=Actinopolymorpha pittospori TaxID=648752 RepID=A0A927REW2_9ACTN|nr:hypothetical protein [Actinopolymorpha pittospori]MBE1612649.1 hypothetical protein [Actinopolymorpha pittospori]
MLHDHMGVHPESDRRVRVAEASRHDMDRRAGGTEQTSVETDRVTWLTPDQVRDRMSEAYAIRLLDALPTDEPRPAIRSHDGECLA